jgi:sporulation protein YlmC with PRC-barrel domain
VNAQLIAIKAPLLKSVTIAPVFAPTGGNKKSIDFSTHAEVTVVKRNKMQFEGLKGANFNAVRGMHKVRALGIALVVCCALGFAPQIVRSDVLVVDVVKVADGMRTGELKGKPVVNDKNERIGTIDDLIIGRDKVLFGILQVGGFLGVGSHYVAVPYQELKISEGPKIVLPGASKEELKSLPEFKYRA